LVGVTIIVSMGGGLFVFEHPRLCAERLPLLFAVKSPHKSHTKHLAFTDAYFCDRYICLIIIQ